MDQIVFSESASRIVRAAVTWDAFARARVSVNSLTFDTFHQSISRFIASDVFFVLIVFRVKIWLFGNSTLNFLKACRSLLETKKATHAYKLAKNADVGKYVPASHAGPFFRYSKAEGRSQRASLARD